jgi:hypothetical protein
MEIEVTRAELDEVQSWLRVLSGAGKAEDGGAGEDAGSNEVFIKVVRIALELCVCALGP